MSSKNSRTESEKIECYEINMEVCILAPTKNSWRSESRYLSSVILDKMLYRCHPIRGLQHTNEKTNIFIDNWISDVDEQKREKTAADELAKPQPSWDLTCAQILGVGVWSGKGLK